MLRKLQSSENSIEEESISSNENVRMKNDFTLNNEEKLLLEEQIRKFVQLVTQSYLLSCGESKISEWNFELNLIKESSKQILLELRDIALKNSLFAAYNLEGALDIISECEKQKDTYSKAKCPRGISYIVRKTIFCNQVFMYPELLPNCGFVGQNPNRKVFFTKAEDNLIALGLERFSGEFDPIHKIQNHLMPCKEKSQIKIRIKNLRSSKSPKDNPVKYYYTHKTAPPMPRNFQIFDPNEVKAPQDLKPSKDLPEWIMSLFSRVRYRSKYVKFYPNHKKTISKPLFILPKSIIIQNHNILHPVIPQQLDVKKVIKRNVIKPPLILPKDIVKDNEEFHFDVSDESHNINDTVKTQDIVTDEPLVMPNDKIKDNIRIAKHKVKKVIKRNLFEIYNKPPLILTKDIVKDDEEFHFDVGDESHNTNDAVKTQDIDKSLVMLNDKINECSKEIITGEYAVSDKAISSHLNGLNNKCDKTSIASDIVIKTEIIDELCDSSQNTSLSHCDTTKMPSSSLLNEHNNELNSNFVESEIENKDVEIDISVSGITKLVQPHHIKQEIKDDFETAQTCKFARDVNKQDINISKHTLVTKQVNKSVDYIPDPNDKECGIVIKSEIIEESNDSLKDVCKIDFDLEETLLVDFRSATNGYSHSLQKRNLSLEKLPILNKRRRILHDNFHTLTDSSKPIQMGEQNDSYPMRNFKNNNKIANTIIIADMTGYGEGISIKSEIIDSETSLLQNTSDISDKPMLKTTKSIINSNSLEKAHVKKSIRTVKRKRRKQKRLTIRKVRKKN